MGNRDKNTDNFDLGSFDDFDEPSFTSSNLTDDIDLTPTDVVTTQGGRNTRFIVLASILVLLIMLGAVGIILLAIDQSRKQESYQQTVVAVLATNTQQAIFRALTETANAWTDTPTYTPTPTDTPTPTETPTPTPTDTPDFTQTADAIGTANAQATQTEAVVQLSMVPIQLTQTAEAGRIQTLEAFAAAQTLTALAPTITLTPTAPAPLDGSPTATSVIVVTVVGPTQQPQPVVTQGTQGPVVVTGQVDINRQTPFIVVVVTNTPIPTLNLTEQAGTQIALGTTTPTGQLPDTGFFDDVVLANAGPMGMTMLTISAAGLVTLIIAARRLRVRA